MPGAISRKTRGRQAKNNLSSGPASTMQRDISKFARVAKCNEVGKALLGKNKSSGAQAKSSIEIVLPLSGSRKRKADNESDVAATSSSATQPKKLRQDIETTPLDEITNSSRTRKPATPITAKITAKTTLEPAAVIASSKRKRQPEADALDENNESSSAAALLERLNLQASPIRKRTKIASRSTAGANRSEGEGLPQELLDLLSLHTSFLKTLSLHLAHNGTNSAVDLHAICLSVAQSWGKRKVTVEDIRRCIGILNWREAGDAETTTSHRAPFSLVDFGRSRICIELLQHVAALDEHHLNATFEANLRAMWTAREDSNMQWFAASLPKAVIRAGSSATKISPLLAKGQKTMEEMRELMAKKQQEKEARTQQAQAPAVTNADGSKMSLLERIRFKEQQAAQEPQGPTPAELQRRAALQRAQDVAAVLAMLVTATANGQPRISFTMSVVLMKLKDSMRIPISQEEGAACVRLLAAEVAPRWLRVVTIGGKENVVLQRAFQPSGVAIQERVKELSM